MKSLPRRQSLVSQTADILRDEIRGGTWQGMLPGERALCSTLQVSRNTLRSALAQLKREGVIRSEQGAGNRIVTRPRSRRRGMQSHDVALLAPEALERMRPSQTLWIDELRALLIERGCRLHVLHGRQYFRTNPGPVLQKLVEQNRHGCWILMLSNEGTQRWFEANGISAIVAGSVHGNIGLPYRDLDHRAMCRHAAGVFLGLGHRRLALLVARSKFAGDLESEAGFIEGVERSRTEAVVQIAHHDGSTGGIVKVLERLLGGAEPVSALLVANAYHYLTTVSCLARMGKRVPQEISVISRDQDLFLSFLVPEPSRYEVSAHGMARALVKPVMELLEVGSVSQAGMTLMPEFIRGESIGWIRPIA